MIGPPITEAERELLRRAAEWPADSSVAEATRAHGLDFATAVLHERLLRMPHNRLFAEKALSSEADGRPQCDVIGVVPGAFYRSHSDTGANGERIFAIARELGCAAELVPVESFGTLEKNAEIILRWIEERPGKKIALISLSKGSGDVRRALQSPRASTLAGMTWVSFSGMGQGTPLVDWLRSRPLRWLGVRFLLWWGGHDITALHQLASNRHEWPPLPGGMRVVHVYGFPMQSHLRHRWAGRGYRRLAPSGPNDGGGILLESLMDLPGTVCPIWGADHYLRPDWDAEPLFQRIVAQALSAPPKASQNENPPNANPATRSSA